MLLTNILLLPAASFLLVPALALPSSIPALTPRQESPFAGYLLTSFRDSEHGVDFHLSNGNSPLSYTKLNGDQPTLRSNLGTRGVRDMYLAPNPDRTMWYLLSTDLDIRPPNFSWDQATRTGSKDLVLWTSPNLIDWSEPRLVRVEAETAGMAWAPSIVYDATTELYNIFWSSRQYAEDDVAHSGPPVTLDRIRYATTKDFVTFSPPQDYHSEPDTGLIDQEFQHLGGDSWVRNFKNETNSFCYQEISENGLFGDFVRTPGYAETGYAHEAAAMFADNTNAGRYFLLLDDFVQYYAYTTDDIQNGGWTRAEQSEFPVGAKHGVVTPLTQSEYDALAVAAGNAR